MYALEKISEIYFSPSNTTKKIVEKIAENFEGTYEIHDLLNYEDDGEIRNFGDFDLVIVGMPVFSGRIPKIAREKLERIKADNVPAIAFVNRGNANVGSALVELTDLLTENGFNVIGAAVFVSQHSIFTKVAHGRPDEKDFEKIKEFAEKCREKLESNDLSTVKDIPGEKPYLEYKIVPFKATCDETLCSFCYDCVSICPQDAIPDDDPVSTDADKCDGCSACIYICPEDARSFDGPIFKEKEPIFVEAHSDRGEPEFYF